MKAADLLSAGLFLAISLGIIKAGWDLGLGTMMEPGSGFMIFWIGVAMALFCLTVLAGALRQPAGRGLAAIWEGLTWYKVPYVAVLLVVYTFLLPTLGFLATTALLLIVLFKTIEPQSWVVAIVGAAVTTGIAYLVFDRWLGTQLPAGTLWAA